MKNIKIYKLLILNNKLEKNWKKKSHQALHPSKQRMLKK